MWISYQFMAVCPLILNFLHISSPKWLVLADHFGLPNFLPQLANFFTRIYPSYPWHFPTLMAWWIHKTSADMHHWNQPILHREGVQAILLWKHQLLTPRLWSSAAWTEMGHLVWESSEMGRWMDPVITASFNIMWCLSFAAGMVATWTDFGGSRMVQLSMSQIATCDTWTHCLVQGWSAGDLSAASTGQLAHQICHPWTSVCGGISRARSYYKRFKSSHSNNALTVVVTG